MTATSRSIVLATVLVAAAAVPSVASEVPFAFSEETIGPVDGAAVTAVADLDRDGDLDVVAAALEADVIRIWINNLPGAWTPVDIRASFDQAISVAVADVNKDGWPDVIAVSRDSGRVIWWEQTYPRFSEYHRAEFWISGTRSVVPADLDGDGDLDLVVAGESGDEVAWIPNERIHHRFFNSFWQSSDQLATVGGLAVGDLDGNGRPDVAVTAANNTTDPDIAFWTDFNLNDRVVVASDFAWAEDLALADVNGDGRLDVVAVSSGTDTVAWFENTRAGFSQHTISTTADAAIAVDAGDVNNDGDVDVVVAAYLDDRIYLYRKIGGAGTS